MDSALNARSALKSSHRNETSRSIWKNTNGMVCGRITASALLRMKFISNVISHLTRMNVDETIFVITDKALIMWCQHIISDKFQHVLRFKSSRIDRTEHSFLIIVC